MEAKTDIAGYCLACLTGRPPCWICECTCDDGRDLDCPTHGEELSHE